MTDEEARSWIASRVDSANLAKLDAYAGLLVIGNDQQNLIAPSTVPTLWSRHILDSAQLLDCVSASWTSWVDIGSGAGLPGLVIAVLTGQPVALVEPRRLRVGFLEDCVTHLGLSNVSVIKAKAAAYRPSVKADVVSARAVAPLETLFAESSGFASKDTIFVLPKGESAESEVAVARRSWQGAFHVKQSIVDPKSGIVVATGVSRR